MAAQVGQPAPGFAMEGIKGRDFVTVSLGDYAGKWVVFFFYPLDFTFVCPTEIKEFSRRCPDFTELNAQVLGVSVDSKYAHLAWVDDIGEQAYPLLSDLTKEVSRCYGVLQEDAGYTFRATFIIDPDQYVRYAVIQDENIGRSVDETLRVLSALQTGELCPVQWEPGEETLGKAA